MTTGGLSTPFAEVLRTGAPWRDLPPDYGDWKNTHRRFCRWRDRGVWAGLLEEVMDDPDFEWLMIDASYIKPIPTVPALGAEIYCPHQRGLNSKLHLAVDSHGMPVRLAVTGGTVADCSSLPLIEGIEAECLLADMTPIHSHRSGIGNEPSDTAQKQPERKAGLRPGTVQVAALGGERILFKQWRGVATRYAKRAASYLATNSGQ